MAVKGQNDGTKNFFYYIPSKVRYMWELKEHLRLNSKDLEDWESIPELQTTFRFPDSVYDLETLNEWLGDSFYLGNILKTFWLHMGRRHRGTDTERELNKRKHYMSKLKEKRERLKCS